MFWMISIGVFHSTLLILLLLLQRNVTSKVVDFSNEELVEFYQKFDSNESFRDVYPACLDDGNVGNICPPEEDSIPCGPVENIEKWCTNHVKGNSAAHHRGCVKFVGYHIMSPHFMYACCDSTDECDIFLEDQFDTLGIFAGYDDDDGYPSDISSHQFKKMRSDLDDDSFADDDDNNDDDDDKYPQESDGDDKYNEL